MERPGGRLTHTQICQIMETGRKCGVKSISIHKSGITVSYLDMMPEPEHVPEPEITKPSPDMNKELQELRYDEMIEQIKILDPSRYEELLAQGAIEDVHDEQDDI